MKRLPSFALSLLAAVLTAGTAAAQNPAPGAEPPSDRGFVVGMHLAGSTLPAGPQQEAARSSGGGVGLTLGYRLDERLTLFARSTVAYRLGSIDVGARYRFGTPGAALRPYLEAAVTRAAGTNGIAIFENGEMVDGTRYRYGMAFTAGAGVEYGITSSLGLDVGVAVSSGRFTTGEFRGEEFGIREGFTTARVNLGLTWTP